MEKIKIKKIPTKEEAQEINTKIAAYEKHSKHRVDHIFTKLNIHSDAQHEFENIRMQKECTIKIYNYFDLYKLSIYLDIKFLRDIILAFYSKTKLTDDQIIRQIYFLQNHLSDDLEAQYFYDFLEKGNIISYFSKNIQRFICETSFQQLSVSIIEKILAKSTRINIPPNSLYKYIKGSIKERVNLLRYMNFKLFFQKVSSIDFKDIIISMFQNYDDIINELMKLIPDQNQVNEILKEKKQNSIALHYLSRINTNKSDTSLTYQYPPHSKQSEMMNSSSYKRYSDRNQQIPVNSGTKPKSDTGTQISHKQPKYDKLTRSPLENKNTRAIYNSNDETKSRTQPAPKKHNGTTTQNALNHKKSPQNTVQNYETPEEEISSEESDNEKGTENVILNGKGKKRNDDNDDTIQKGTSNDQNDSKEDDTPDNDTANIGNKNGNHHNSYANSLSNHSHFRPLSKDDEERQIIWIETCKILENGVFIINGKKIYISKYVSESVARTKTIRPTEKLPFSKREIKHKIDANRIYQKVQICNMTTFEAARKCIEADNNSKVCVLNFASATKPGGGVLNGRGAQEETLSRMSSLYWTLINQKEMYEYNKTLNDPYYSDYMIFSPNVVVFRDDDYKLIEPYFVSVISSPAVNCFDLKKICCYDENKVIEVMRKRCRRILEVCLSNDIKTIVLGAFGCGVFGNRAENISEIFRKLIVDEGYGEYFDKIIFAIMTTGNGYTLNTFKQAFNKK